MAICCWPTPEVSFMIDVIDFSESVNSRKALQNKLWLVKELK
jgi:hypothetical protein